MNPTNHPDDLPLSRGPFYDQELQGFDPAPPTTHVNEDASVIDLFGTGASAHAEQDPLESDDPALLLEEAIYVVAEARALPMSTTVKVHRDDLLDLLEAARDCLPAELAAARGLLRRRDEVIERAQQEAAEILADAHHQASRMVERTEIVRAAENRARQIVQAGTDHATEKMLKADEFCDQRLAQLQNLLDDTARLVIGGRAKLAGNDRRDPSRGGQSEIVLSDEGELLVDDEAW